MANKEEVKFNKSRWLDDESYALISVGFITPMDCVLAAIVILGTAAAGIYSLYNDPNYYKIVISLLILIIVVCCWVVSLVYRACYFILKMRSVIELMPEQAAKMAFSLHLAKASNPVPDTVPEDKSY